MIIDFFKKNILSFKDIFKSGLIRNTFQIASGNIISQVLGIIFTPILSRIYGPLFYGEFGIFLSTYNLINSIMCLGLISAIISPKEDKEASDIYKLCIVSCVVISTLFLIIVLGISPFVKVINIGSNYFMICILLAISFISNNLLSISVIWANRKQKYNIIFWNPILASTSNFIITFLFGFSNAKQYGLILGMVISQIIIFVYLTIMLNPLKNFKGLPDFKKTLKKYSDFPKYQMTSSFFKAAASNLPILMMSTYFGNIFIGQYNMGQRLLFMPITFVASALGQVHFKQATDIANRGQDVGQFTFKVIKIVIIVIYIPFLSIGIFGDTIFRVFLGNEWILGGVLSKIRSLEFLYTAMFFSTSYIFVIIKRQRVMLIYTLISFLMNIFMLLIGGRFLNNSMITTALLSGINILLYFFLYLYVFKCTSFGTKKYLQFMLTVTISYIVIQVIGNIILI